MFVTLFISFYGSVNSYDGLLTYSETEVIFIFDGV